MAQQQQTVLRVQTNIPPNIDITGSTTLFVTQQSNVTYGGAGTQVLPITGRTTSTFAPEDLWYITLQVTGGTGTFYYTIDMSPYTGTNVDLYELYNIRFIVSKPDGSIEGMGGFSEYGISDLVGSFEVNDEDRIFIDAGMEIPTGATMSFYVIPNNETTIAQQLTYDTLDLYSDIPIKLNKSFAELQDIGKRNSDYSVGLSLPGSKKNNAFFESYFNVDTDSLYFDVTRRVNIDVLISDEKYFTGYMRLNKVSVINSKVEYDVTLYSTVADLYGKMGNNLLKDLNYDDMDWHFNHYFNLYGVASTWNQNTLQGPRVIPSLWLYPVVHSGYEYTGDTVNVSGGTTENQTRLYTSTVVGTFTDYNQFIASGGTEFRINSPINPLLDNQLKPALNIYALIQLMFKTYGYTIKSDFFESPWFKLLYMYGFYSFDGTKFGFKSPQPQTFTSEGVELRWVFRTTPTRQWSVYVVKKGTGIPAFCSEEITGNLRVRNLPFPSSFDDYPFIISPGSTGYTRNLVSNQVYNASTASVPISSQPISYTPRPANTNTPFVDGTYVDFSLVIDTNIKQIDILSSLAKKFNLVFIPDPENPNQMIIEPYDYYIGTGVIHDWTDKLSFDKGFTVQPALNFVESELLLTDQEDGDEANKTYKDRNKLIYGQNLVYNETDFKSQSKKIDTIFSPEVIRKWDDRIGIPLGINYAGQSTTQTSGNSERVIWKYTGLKQKPRLIFNLGNLSPFLDEVGESYNFGSSVRVNTMFFRLQPSNGVNPGAPAPDGRTYAIETLVNPGISHTMPIGNKDSNKNQERGFNNDSICILFNSEEPQDIGLGIPTFNAYTDNDAYNLFYSNRVNNLYNKNTRFLDGLFNITLSDIKNLRPNDVIKIQEQYFYLNKLEGFDLSSPELTKVQLVQTNLTPQKYPTRYFKYRYCNETNNRTFKFRTFFNPVENTEGHVYFTNSERENSIRRTYYFWSIYYDYMVGVLGGNVSSITSSYIQPGFGDTWAYTMTEITEEEYNNSNYLYWYEDVNDLIFIDRVDLVPNLNLAGFASQSTQPFWVFSNSGVTTNKAFFNVASGCTQFQTFCNQNAVTLSPAPGSTPASPYTTGITLNITDTGWIKYDTETETKYRYFGSLGNADIPDCADCSTIRDAIPFADLATWTVVDCGNTC
jgi:hypothetical protein